MDCQRAAARQRVARPYVQHLAAGHFVYFYPKKLRRRKAVFGCPGGGLITIHPTAVGTACPHNEIAADFLAVTQEEKAQQVTFLQVVPVQYHFQAVGDVYRMPHTGRCCRPGQWHLKTASGHAVIAIVHRHRVAARRKIFEQRSTGCPHFRQPPFQRTTEGESVGRHAAAILEAGCTERVAAASLTTELQRCCIRDGKGGKAAAKAGSGDRDTIVAGRQAGGVLNAVEGIYIPVKNKGGSALHFG